MESGSRIVALLLLAFIIPFPRSFIWEQSFPLLQSTFDHSIEWRKGIAISQFTWSESRYIECRCGKQYSETRIIEKPGQLKILVGSRGVSIIRVSLYLVWAIKFHKFHLICMIDLQSECFYLPVC
jgi:hypothetical protein